MKKLLALLLALIMVFAMVACTGRDLADDPVDPGTTDPGTTDPGTTDPVEEEESFYLSSFYSKPDWDGSLPLVKEGEDNVLTIGVRTSASTTDYEDNDLTRYLEAKTGLDLQFVQFSSNASDASTQVSLMVASGETLPDILIRFTNISNSVAKEYVRDGYFVDLRPYFEKDAFYMRKMMDLYYPDPEQKATMERYVIDTISDPLTGGIWTVPSIWNNPGDSTLCHTLINQQWLDTLGLEAPTNIDELYDVLVAFRDKDPNGNGLKDEIPMIGRFSDQYNVVQYLTEAFIYSYEKFTFGVTDDVVWAMWDQPEYRQALIFLNKLVSEGLLSKMTWTCTIAELTAMLNPGEGTPYVVGIVSAPIDTRFEDGHESIFVYEPLDFLDDATGKGGWAPTMPDTVGIGTYITGDCKNPEVAFRFIDLMYDSEQYLFSRYGIEGKHWERLESGNGMTGMFGDEAKVLVLEEMPTPNNITWHTDLTFGSEYYWQRAVNFTEGDWNGEMYSDLQEIIDIYANGKQPEQSMWVMNRSDEEEELYTEVSGEVKSYVGTARANFCTGIWDPNDDADWDNYIAELEGMGYYDTWLVIAQDCWNRQAGLE